ncbi:CsxC family protein [Ectobacillus polymachus]|uniref:CsxC family protein n=1 Tax=Ectobacillus polymachus TaxID=1508806 RepID=UPI003A890623
MNENNQVNQPMDPPGPCTVNTTPLSSFTNINTPTVTGFAVTAFIKVPVVTVETTIQIPLEATITLTPAATEIKRVKKNVFLDQVKLIPVAFTRIDETDFFNVRRAKLFVAGHIRKNIEYTTSGSSAGCTTALQDRVVDINFSGFTDILHFNNFPIIGISETAEANFLSETNNLNARLDKFFFQNLVKFNEQPFGELVAANFFELDFSPTVATPEAPFSTLTEKIVLELTIKVLQNQQLAIEAVPVVPRLEGLTPPAS